MPVEIQGLVETRKALRQFAPDIYKEMNKEISVALKQVTNAAKKMVPDHIAGLRNFQDNGQQRQSRTSRDRAFPMYNQSLIRKGLTYTTALSGVNKSGFKSLYTLLNKDAVGSIIETAARKSGFATSAKSQSNNPDAGRHFDIAISNSIGKLTQVGTGDRTRGRLLYRAYSENQGKALNAVMHSIDKATKLYASRVATGVAPRKAA